MTKQTQELPERPAEPGSLRTSEGASRGPSVVGASGVAVQSTLGGLVPALADYAFLHADSDGRLTEVASLHRDPSLAHTLARWLEQSRPRMTAPGSIIHRAFRLGAAHVSELGPGPVPAPERSGTASLLGPRCYVTVPVQTREVRYGVLTLARFETEHPFSRAELRAAEAVAGQLGAMLDLASRLDELEGKLARTEAVSDTAAARVSEVRSELEDARAEAARARSDAEDARAEAEEVSGRVREAEERAGKAEAHAEAYASDVARLRSELDDAGAQAARAARDLDEARQEAQAAHTRADEAEARAESATEQADADRQQARAALQEAEAAHQEAEASRQQAEHSTAERIRDLERALAAVRRELDLARAQAGAAAEVSERERHQGPLPGSSLSSTSFEARLLDAVGEAVIATDLDGRIVYWNRAAERLYGWSRGEAVGRDLGDTAPAVTSREQASHAMARMMAGETWTGELRVRRKDGSTFPASLTGTPIFGDSGEPIGLICISTDRTARKNLEERLLQAQRAQAVGRVAGGVAHEFNNCLTSISGYTELIRRELELDDPLLDDLEAIQESAGRAATLIHQLLAYTRRQVLRPRVTSLNRILSTMEPVLRSLLGEKIEVDVELEASPDRVRVDEGQIEQVITNLILNAQEAIADQGHISIRTETVELTEADARRYTYPVTTGTYVALVVEDDGEGMDAETLEHAFEPFYTTKKDGLGTGLGLSTAYGVIKQSGGYVWMKSAPDQGTRVRMVLPLAEAEETAPVEPARRSGPTLADRVVLLVEDDTSVRDLARRILEQDGHDVLEAEDGIQALKVWEEEHARIDMVVTDVVMPQMSGRALVDRLRTLRPDLPVLYMSGYTDDAVALHGIAEGRDPLLGKPFSSEALSMKVRDLLAGAGVASAG